MAGLIIEAKLQKKVLAPGQGVIGRAVTDGEGRFVLQASANRRDIVLAVSKKGKVSKLLGVKLNPSTKEENLFFTSIPEQKKK